MDPKVKEAIKNAIAQGVPEAEIISALQNELKMSPEQAQQAIAQVKSEGGGGASPGQGPGPGPGQGGGAGAEKAMTAEEAIDIFEQNQISEQHVAICIDTFLQMSPQEIGKLMQGLSETMGQPGAEAGQAGPGQPEPGQEEMPEGEYRV